MPGLNDYLLRVGGAIRLHFQQPLTWAHVIAASLDYALRDSTYRKEPLVRELRRALQREVLDKIPADRPVESGLSDADLSRASSSIEAAPEVPTDGYIHDRVLCWLAGYHQQTDDWTLQKWRALLAEFNVESGHFAGTVEWPGSASDSQDSESRDLALHWSERLQALVGLKAIKDDVHRLRDYLYVRKMRIEHKLPPGEFTMHQVFLGNPGTGKTSVARILAGIYKEFGFLSKGHLIETSRTDLVGRYVGETEEITAGVIRSALGGVLFIDEAYSLTTGGEQDFGPRAVDTLVKMMEDHRQDLVVIVAGYEREMTQFINSNTGLHSRFTRFLEFPNYSQDELCEIMRGFAAREHYNLDAQGTTRIQNYLVARQKALGDHFGNAREVRNLWEQIKVYQATRLVRTYADKAIPRDALVDILKEDVPQLRGI